jgi:C4-dicarboxylate transporter DctQ subunit
MVATVAANVFGRFLLGISIQWGEEVAKIMLTYLTFFGAAYAMKDNSHYSFDFIVQKLPLRIKPFFMVFRWVIIILISLLLLFWSAEVTLKIRHWIMPSTGISRSLVYGAAPAGILLLMIYSIHNLIEQVKTISRP